MLRAAGAHANIQPMPRLLVPLLLVAAGARGAEYHYVAGDAGRLRCGAVPDGWQRPEVDVTPLYAPVVDLGAPDAAAADAGARSDGGAPPDAGVPPCDALRIRRSFDVGPEAARLATLTLTARYQDGIVAWLNGVEVARRRLQPGAALASEPHGPEPERFVVPLAPGLLRPTNNVLAVEVRPWKPTRAPAATVALDGNDTLRFLRGPYLQRVLDGEAWLLVDTDLPSRVTLRWSRADGAGGEHEAGDGQLATRHRLRMTHLAAGTAYRYHLAAACDAAGAAEAEAAFHTPPAAGHPLRFAVFGDVRSGHDVHAAIVRAVAAEDPDLVIMTGDLVDRGTDEGDWERFFDVAEPLLKQVAIYPAAGNHEYARRGRGVARWADSFLRGGDASWYSFEVAGVHFICLDSEAFGNPDQRAWLERDLQQARARKVRAIVAYDHDGPWSSQLHGDNRLAATDYAPLLDKYRVTVVFAGHDHDYERGRVGGLEYVVTGGGGAELRTPRCGVPGTKKCGARVRAFANEHHYLMVEVLRDRMKLCPKRPDGTLLEPCPLIPLRR